MTKLKRVFALVLSVCVLLTTLGCSAEPLTAQSAAPQPVTDDTVIDATGATLTIPEAPATIASVYAVSVPFIVALGLSEQVVAINCKSRFWTDNVPALSEAGSVGRGVVDLEALATFHPTVLIHRSNDSKTVEAVSPLGVDVLCIRAENMQDVADTLRLMGKYFGASQRAEEVIAWMDGKFAYIDSIVAKIPQSERVTALTMGGELGRIAGGDMLQSWMIEKAGGIPVATDVENNCNWAQVGVEKVFEYDPQFLFLTSSTPLDYTADEVLSEPAWSAMRAVRDGRVLQIPARIDSWDMPGVVSVIGTMWMLNSMYPEYFTKEQLAKEVDEYYTFLFDKTFTPEYLGYGDAA